MSVLFAAQDLEHADVRDAALEQVAQTTTTDSQTASSPTHSPDEDETEALT